MSHAGKPTKNKSKHATIYIAKTSQELCDQTYGSRCFDITEWMSAKYVSLMTNLVHVVVVLLPSDICKHACAHFLVHLPLLEVHR